MSHLGEQLARACGMAPLPDDLKAVCRQFRYDSPGSFGPFIGSEVVGDRTMTGVRPRTREHKTALETTSNPAHAISLNGLHQ